MQNLEKGRLGFVAVAIDGDTPDLLAQRVGTVVETALKHGGTIEKIFASAVIITFGMSIKTIHGVRSAIYGNIGDSHRAHFGAIISGLPEVLRRLSILDWGEAVTDE